MTLLPSRRRRETERWLSTVDAKIYDARKKCVEAYGEEHAQASIADKEIVVSGDEGVVDGILKTEVETTTTKLLTLTLKPTKMRTNKRVVNNDDRTGNAIDSGTIGFFI